MLINLITVILGSCLMTQYLPIITFQDIMDAYADNDDSEESGEETTKDLRPKRGECLVYKAR